MSKRERLYEQFRSAMTQPDADDGHVAAEIDARLREIQAEEQRQCTLRLWVLWAAAATGLCGAGTVLSETNHQQSHVARTAWRGVLVGMTSLVLVMALRESVSSSATDKLIQLWQRDPRKLPLQLSLAPAPGGMLFGLSGGF